jgi:hypothetical protein
VVARGGKGHDDPEIALWPGLRAQGGWRGERRGGQRGQYRTTHGRGHARKLRRLIVSMSVPTIRDPVEPWRRAMASERSGPHGVGGDPAGPCAREAHDPVHSAKEADAIRTLRSSSPRGVLGRPLASYRSLADCSRAVREPRAGLAEFGLALPDGVEVRVHDSTAENRYLVVPARPAGTEGWSEERLAGLVSRDAMIGVAQARCPA